jgi:hypothetical protein
MPPMSLTDLQNAIDEHGADIAAWPAPLRERATVLVANSAEARTRLAEALRMEASLRTMASVKAPEGLADRIVAAATADKSGRRRG